MTGRKRKHFRDHKQAAAISGGQGQASACFYLYIRRQPVRSGGSYMLRPIINNLVSPEQSAEEKLNKLAMGIMIMACIYIVGVICTYLQQKVMIGVSQKALVRIREELFCKIQKLLKYHDTHAHGDIMSRLQTTLIRSEKCSAIPSRIFWSSYLNRHNHTDVCHQLDTRNRHSYNGAFACLRRGNNRSRSREHFKSQQMRSARLTGISRKALPVRRL